MLAKSISHSLCESLVQSFDDFLNCLIFKQNFPEILFVKTEWNYFKTILNENPISKEKLNRYLKMLKQNKFVNTSRKNNTNNNESCNVSTQTLVTGNDQLFFPKRQKGNFACVNFKLQKVQILDELLNEEDSKLNQTVDTPLNLQFQSVKNPDYGYGSAQDSLNNSPKLIKLTSTPQERGNKSTKTGFYQAIKNERQQLTDRKKITNRSYQQKSSGKLSYRAFSLKNIHSISKNHPHYEKISNLQRIVEKYHVNNINLSILCGVEYKQQRLQQNSLSPNQPLENIEATFQKYYKYQ